MEYLVTNIMEPSFCTNTFKELYFLRWGIEDKYREIKVNLKLEDFSGIKPEIIKQDSYATVFLSNLVSLLKSEAGKRIKPDNASRNRYQANKVTIISQTKRGIIS